MASASDAGRAMWLTVATLSISALVHLTKGLDYEEALICLGLAAALFARREDYVVSSRPISVRNGAGLMAGFTLLYYAYDLLGFRILYQWIFPHPTFQGALARALDYLTDSPMYSYHGYQAHWFGTSLVLIGSFALAMAAFSFSVH